jgi:hypothetical protein
VIKPAPVYRLTQMTRDERLTIFPALSPDGKLLAYSSNRAGTNNRDIWVQQVTGGDSIQLTHHEASDMQPSFSPDGNWIVFFSERDGGGVYVVPSLGGGERLLTTDDGQDPRFSPDGKWISYAVVYGAGDAKLYVIPASGGASREVKTNLPSVFAAMWSPDGRYLIFSGNDKGYVDTSFRPGAGTDWYAIPLEGGEVTKLGVADVFRKAGIHDADIPRDWISSGTEIIFEADRNIWKIPVSTQDWTVGIATTPNETYAITGLKIKAASPLKHNIVIELANGGDGYIPPPEQHRFGGYNTWAARSAGLEVSAEPRITEACIELLEKVTGQPRRNTFLSFGPAAEAIAAMKPLAWWRLNEFAGPRALDSTGQERDAFYEPDVTYFLEGPRSDQFCKDGEKNRAAMFVGGRLQGQLFDLRDEYSMSLWLWNGMPNEGREVSGWFFSRGTDHGLSLWSDHLGIGGTSGHAGKLIFFHGDDDSTIQAGKTIIPRWEWQQVTLVRSGETVKVYLNGELELETKTPAGFPQRLDQVFLGGRSDNQANWEGRLDEIAIFNRALTPIEAKTLAGK